MPSAFPNGTILDVLIPGRRRIDSFLCRTGRYPSSRVHRVAESTERPGIRGAYWRRGAVWGATAAQIWPFPGSATNWAWREQNRMVSHERSIPYPPHSHDEESAHPGASDPGGRGHDSFTCRGQAL